MQKPQDDGVSTGGNDVQANPASDAYEYTMRYLSAVASREQQRPGAGPPLPPPPGQEVVRDVMVTAVVAAHEGAVFKEIVDALIRNRISAVPVIDADRRVLGVVSESDLLVRVSRMHLSLPRDHHLSGRGEERHKLHAATARELMTSPAVVISPGAAIADAAWHALRSRVRRLPVVDENGVLVGIVTRSDLLLAFLRPDEQISEDIRQNLIVGAFLMDPDRVEVTVEEGVVTLRGGVERRAVAVELVDAVRGVSGVVDVVDTLTYSIDDALPPALPGPPPIR
jgi:CBS domain-containing protein